ncbi:MAG: hypothetical protein JXJ04_23760, partial [Spirochaetales bacterium]|nr:hypothetical protein [Spirochaetales bacterium]
ECINVIIKEKSALFVDQYINILIQIAYCYADMDNQNKALEIYKIREAILKQDKNFNKLLPDGLTLLAKEDYGQNELLAQNYQEEGIAFYHLKDLINSKNCFEEGTKIYIDLNKKDLAAKNFYYYGELSKYYQNWNELLYAGNKITSIFGKSISKEYLILSLKYKLQANINLKNYNDAKNIMQELLQIEKEINHPDYKDDLDIWNLLKDF